METSMTELAKELFVNNPYEHYSTIEVKDESGNQFTFLFKSTGYNEYTQHIFKCKSDLFESPISFYITTISDSFNVYDITYDNDALKYEEILCNAIELAIPIKPTEWDYRHDIPSWWKG